MSDEHRITVDADTQDDRPPADIPPGDDNPAAGAEGDKLPKEIGGRAGPDPTRYGDWEKNGRCIDF